MRKTAIALLVLGLVVASSAFASNAVRISKVYGGGGNTGALYTNDFVELFNSSSLPANIGGWSLQYGSATGTSALGSCTNCNTPIPTGATIPACGYYLVQLAAGTTVTNLPLPIAADLVIPQATATNLGGASGKIGLMNSSVNTLCSPTNAWVDLYGFGSANCYETTVGGGLSNTQAGYRVARGLKDTDVNSADFVVRTLIGTEVADSLYNTASPVNPNCYLPPPTGACCLRHTTPGACVVTTSADCTVQGGIYLGNAVACDAGVCAVPAKNTTWGKVKTLYR